MKKKNIISTIIIVFLLVIAGIVICNNQGINIGDLFRDRDMTPLDKTNAEFTVYDTASVTKLFFADKSGNEVLLERQGNIWMVNNEFQANQNLINEMLFTLTRMRIKMPVSVKKNDNVITQMAATNTKVEVYQMLPRINIFNKIKLFYHETRSRVFYIGGVTQDNNGTYILKEGGDKVYVVYLNGFRGFISSRFSANPMDWRNHFIFNSSMGDIQTVKLEINGDPENSFVINENGRYQYTMTTLTDKPVEFSDNKVLTLMQNLCDVRFEAFLDDVDPARRDSIINSPFMDRLTVTTKDGKTKSVTIFKLNANADMYDYSPEDLEEFDDMIKDPDHKYALLSEGNEFVLIQDFVFEKLLKPAYYYSKDYKEDIHQVYYQELETVESR